MSNPAVWTDHFLKPEGKLVHLKYPGLSPGDCSPRQALCVCVRSKSTWVACHVVKISLAHCSLRPSTAPLAKTYPKGAKVWSP